MTSEKKKRANRRNSRLSTGPRDTSKTRHNALKHGISSVQAIVPVVDGDDAAERYDERRDGLWQELAPQGTLEAAIVDQIAVALQQHRRLMAYENAVIQGHAEASFERWNERNQIDRATIELEEMQVALNHLNGPEDLGDVADPTYLVKFLWERCGVSSESAMGDPIETRIAGDREISSYSPEQLQDLVAFGCEQGQFSEEDLRAQLKEYLGELIHWTEKKLERNGQEIELRRGWASVPDDAELNRILKYQSRIDRGFYKSLHELQRLQAARQGGNPLLPAAVDVTVNVDATTPNGAGLGTDDFSRETAAAEVGAVIVEGRIAGGNSDGQRGPSEVREISETLSDSQSTDKGSQEAGASSSQTRTGEEETRTADPGPEAQQRSGEVRHKFKTPERKGLKLKDYLGQAGMSKSLDQRDEPEASEDDIGEIPTAGELY